MARQRIEIGAARMAIEWECLFAMEICQAAANMAGDAEIITQTHYRAALPHVLARLADVIDSQSHEHRDAPSAKAPHQTTHSGTPCLATFTRIHTNFSGRRPVC